MIQSIEDLRARIASGDIKPPSGGGGKGVGEGTFLSLIEKADFGRGEGGNLRGSVECKVLSGGTDQDIGGRFNVYIPTTNQTYLEQLIAEWTGYMKLWGISEDKAFEDAEDMIDIMGNIVTQVNKLAIKGQLRMVVERKAQKKINPKSGKPYYFNNIKEVSRVTTEEPAKAAATPPVQPPTQAPTTAAPAAAEPTPSATAQVQPPAKKKPWAR